MHQYIPGTYLIWQGKESYLPITHDMRIVKSECIHYAMIGYYYVTLSKW